ncbi:MAG: hypothetical protein WCP57_00130 [Bacteroidota bacterium]
MILEKYRKALRYIGWTVIISFLLIYITYLCCPSLIERLGIDVKSLAKYTIAFFIIKGCITTSIILYSAWYLKKKIKK